MALAAAAIVLLLGYGIRAYLGEDFVARTVGALCVLGGGGVD